jgi:hypothetical protein
VHKAWLLLALVLRSHVLLHYCYCCGCVLFGVLSYCCVSCCRLQVRSILGTFGVLKAFTMLRDAAGKPSGTVLAEFADPGVINAAVAGTSCIRR